MAGIQFPSPEPPRLQLLAAPVTCCRMQPGNASAPRVEDFSSGNLSVFCGRFGGHSVVSSFVIHVRFCQPRLSALRPVMQCISLKGSQQSVQDLQWALSRTLGACRPGSDVQLCVSTPPVLWKGAPKMWHGTRMKSASGPVNPEVSRGGNCLIRRNGDGVGLAQPDVAALMRSPCPTPGVLTSP